jgi:hypothetical protein
MTKQHLSALETYQKKEMIHRDIVHRHLLDFSSKKDLNDMMGRFVDATNTMCIDMQKSFRRIFALEETNKKLCGVAAHAILRNRLFHPTWLDSKLGEIYYTL